MTDNKKTVTPRNHDFILTKVKKTHYHLQWIKFEMCEVTPYYRNIRNQFKDKMDSCFNCGYKFEDGEWFDLASFKSHPNKVMCRKCVTDLIDKENIGYNKETFFVGK